ncbi:MAG: PAS domain-containing protein, partial [Qipengyuania citrea]
MQRGDGGGERATFDQAQQAGRTFSPDSDNFAGATGLLFEQAMAQTRMAVCLTDPHQPDQPIVFCNKAFEKLTGYRQDEIVGRNCRFLQGPKTSSEQIAKLRHAVDNEDVLVVELLNYRKDGSTFWNALHLGPIYDEDGELRYFFGSQWDVSDIHLARAEEKHAKVMAREVSHRL